MYWIYNITYIYNSFEFIIGPTHLNSASCLPTMLDGQLTWSEEISLTMRKSQPGWDPTIPKMFGYFVDLGHGQLYSYPWYWLQIFRCGIPFARIFRSIWALNWKPQGCAVFTGCGRWRYRILKRGAAVRCHRIIEKRFPQTRNSNISCFCSFCHGFIFLDSGLGAVQWGFLRDFHVFCFERDKFSARRSRNDAMTRHIAATNRNYSRCETWEFIALRFRSAMTVVTHDDVLSCSRNREVTLCGIANRQNIWWTYESSCKGWCFIIETNL